MVHLHFTSVGAWLPCQGLAVGTCKTFGQTGFLVRLSGRRDSDAWQRHRDSGAW